MAAQPGIRGYNFNQDLVIPDVYVRCLPEKALRKYNQIQNAKARRLEKLTE